MREGPAKWVRVGAGDPSITSDAADGPVDDATAPTETPSAAESGPDDAEESQGGAFPVVGIGASAGGIEALTRLFRALPSDTGMAFAVVQHLDPTHPSMLTDILSRLTRMRVVEVADRMAVEPNQVYVIPPATTLVMLDGAFQLLPRPNTRGPHRPIDDFLRSLAEERQHRAIGVILSGSANDGTLGLEAIKAEGGITFAQDDTAQHESMPTSAIAAGCVDFVLAPEAIAREIARIARHPGMDPTAGVTPSPDGLADVIDQLRVATGVDFSHYRQNTLHRRITRRIVLHELERLPDYVRLLRANAGEAEALFQDILISVTSFFRNPEAFESLKARVFPKLVKDRSRHETVRIWVMGCSTGEEAYSIAIAFAEFAETLGRPIPLQIFATDLNAVGIDKARAGFYSKSIAADVSPERLARFFVDADGGYRVNKPIRDACVFARHNALTEPPFSRIDLISCRNLLIYFEPALQQRLVPILHYALKPNGYLWLGNAESISAYRDLFDVEDARNKIYAKRSGPSRLSGGFYLGDAPAVTAASAAARAAGALMTVDADKEADRILIARYAPPSVLVRDDLEIVQFRGDTGPYLAPSPGKASLNLLKMLRQGLLVAVRGAVLKARREEASVREEGLRVRSNGGYRDVDVQVIPVKTGSYNAFLILFEEPASPAAAGRDAAAEPPADTHAVVDQVDGAERDIVRLKQELAATREYLQSVIEQQEAANEELQSANEELQSINEEVETSKEEIQSSNEELATVNEELHNRNLELSLSNNDLLNLLASVQIAIVMLGSDFRIRRFTPIAERLFNLIGTDIGRPISDIRLTVSVPDLDLLLREVMETVTVVEREVQDRQGRWYSMRLRPYRTMENRIDGVVMMLVDVDALKRQQEALTVQAQLIDQTLEPMMLWTIGDGVITFWNAAAENVYGFSRAHAVGRVKHELLSTGVPVRAALEQLRRDGQWSGELTNRRQGGEEIVVESRMVLVGNNLVLETNHPITERKQLELALRQRAEALQTADREKNQFIAMLAHELRNPLAPIRNALQVAQDAAAPPEVVEQARAMMDRQIQNMARMIDDLLDVSRLSQGRIVLRPLPVSLLDAIERGVQLVRDHVTAREQVLSVAAPAEPVWIDGDPVRLEQVFGNLLNNASKFTNRRGHIWVTVERPEPSEVAVRVRDDGIGIEPDLLPRVFEPFLQADRSLERVHGGLGIGLTLVRHIVEQHRGTVEAHSAGPGHGSEFVVRLPALAGAPRAVVAPEEAPSPGARLRVLVVDDNADGAESLAMVLRLAGHEVQMAYDGPTAVQLGRRFLPHAIVLDIGLPGMDGYETARRLRGVPDLGRSLFIAMTGYGQPADRERARQAGFDQHYTKPVDPIALRDALARHFP